MQNTSQWFQSKRQLQKHTIPFRISTATGFKWPSGISSFSGIRHSNINPQSRIVSNNVFIKKTTWHLFFLKTLQQYILVCIDVWFVDRRQNKRSSSRYRPWKIRGWLPSPVFASIQQFLSFISDASALSDFSRGPNPFFSFAFYTTHTLEWGPLSHFLV